MRKVNDKTKKSELRPVLADSPNPVGRSSATYRSRFAWILFLLIIFFASERVSAQDPFLEACEKVPFPFSPIASVPQKVSGAEHRIFAEDVPIPPDTLSRSWPDAEGYVPNVYPQKAPEPPLVLRPRYQSTPAKPRQDLRFEEPLPLTPPLTPSATAVAGEIRQVSGREDSFVPSSPQPPLSFQPSLPSLVQPPPVPESFVEEYRRQKNGTSAEAAGSDTRRDTGPYTVNNAHSCDELGCGAACFSRHKLRHLNETGLRKGICDCCGLLTCARKTSGPWFFDGWLEAGAFLNTHWPGDRVNTPLYYNDRNGEAVMNQLYLSAGRRVDPTKGRFDFGGRIDLLYGTDYFHTSALGLETRRQYFFGGQTLDPREAVQHWNSNKGLRRDGTAALYGLSMPQAYAEMFMPIGHGVTVKAGHFYSGMSLESAMAPQNFFYSHSYSFMHGAPTTLTGMTATARLGSRLSVVGGITEGWDVFDSPTGHVNGLFGLHWKSLNQRTAFSFMLHSGEDTMRGNDNRTNYTLTLQQKIGRRWHYALEHAFGYEKNGAYEDVLEDRRGPARWISVAQYLQWQYSETVSIGFRAEWFRDDGHSRVQKSPVSMPFRELTGKDYYELTLGVNWKPNRYVTIRPEVRYDWSNVKVNGTDGVYSGFTKRDMVSFAVDGIFRF